MEFLLEAYAADSVAAERGATRIRERAACASGIRVLRTIFLPEEETSLVLLDAPSADDVRAIVADAGLAIERIAPAVLSPKEDM